MKTAPDSRTLATTALNVAKGYVGIDREHDRKQIAKFLALFGLDFADGSGKPYPYCAAGASYALCKAYAMLTGTPFTSENSVMVFRTILPYIASSYFTLSASCSVMIESAKKKNKWQKGLAGLQEGDFVFFDWQRDGKADHVEICASTPAPGAYNISTIGFNTSNEDNSNGGAVAERTRAQTYVLGYIRL